MEEISVGGYKIVVREIVGKEGLEAEEKDRPFRESKLDCGTCYPHIKILQIWNFCGSEFNERGRGQRNMLKGEEDMDHLKPYDMV